MNNLAEIGLDWLADEVEGMTHELVHILPSEFNEQNRYLPKSVTNIPGPLRYKVNPFMREIVDCFCVNSDVREVNMMKGSQITYSTVLESVALYFMAHVKTLPMMYVTADRDMADTRMKNNFLPMLQQSNLDIIRSNDEGNKRKTGQTKEQIDFIGGGYLKPQGANNAAKMRADSIALMMEDEIDGWPLVVGRDGDPVKLLDSRLKGYWDRRKIFRGSTPLIMGTSQIHKAYLLGDQRKYLVRCIKCRFPQELRWSTENKETGIAGGFDWKMQDGALVLESVCYRCQSCGHPHYEYDKRRLYAPEHGARWEPTATASQPGIRSYHLPGMYCPLGLAPWYSCVADWLEAFDHETGRVKDIGKAQVVYNNIFGVPWEIRGARVTVEHASAHRRSIYAFGQIPNKYAAQYSGSRILFLSCQVDVHDHNLAVTVMGWTRDARTYVIDYWRFEDKDCTKLESPVWGRVKELIEEKRYTADDGMEYGIMTTFVDAGHANDTVIKFCAQWTSGIYPILGRQTATKNQSIKEFTDWETKQGSKGFMITVDHYKDRMAPVLRRDWGEQQGEQSPYHFNVPVDMLNGPLKELTVEDRRKKRDDATGREWWVWHRPSGVANELWDLLIYGHALVEVVAWDICINQNEMESFSWSDFWRYAEDPVNDAMFSRVPVA